MLRRIASRSASRKNKHKGPYEWKGSNADDILIFLTSYYYTTLQWGGIFVILSLLENSVDFITNLIAISHTSIFDTFQKKVYKILWRKIIGKL